MKIISYGPITANMQSTPRKDQEQVLMDLINSVPTVLRDFLLAVFSNKEITTKFCSLPASKSHHHSYPGGLFDHSMECCINAGIAARRSNRLEASIIAVAALFHDIGKIKCFKQNGNKTVLGMNVWHEYLNLEVLAPYLSILDKKNPSVGALFRRLITSSNPSQSEHPGETIVKTQDWISTGYDRHEAAFSSSSDHHHYAYLDGKKYLRTKT